MLTIKSWKGNARPWNLFSMPTRYNKVVWNASIYVDNNWWMIEAGMLHHFHILRVQKQVWTSEWGECRSQKDQWITKGQEKFFILLYICPFVFLGRKWRIMWKRKQRNGTHQKTRRTRTPSKSSFMWHHRIPTRGIEFKLPQSSV